MASIKVYEQGGKIYYQVNQQSLAGPFAPEQISIEYTLSSDVTQLTRVTLSAPNGKGFGPNVLSDIKTINGVTVGTTQAALDNYFSDLGIGSENGGGAGGDTEPEEITGDFWDWLDKPIGYFYLDNDETLRTVNDNVHGRTGKLEVIQRGTGGHLLTINTTDIPVSATGSTTVVGQVEEDGNTRFFSAAPEASQGPVILQEPQNVTTVLGDRVFLDCVVTEGSFDSSFLIFRGIRLPDFEGTSYSFELSPETTGTYQFGFQRGTRPPVLSRAVLVKDSLEVEPVIDSEPGDDTVDVGASYNFNLSVISVPPSTLNLQRKTGTTSYAMEKRNISQQDGYNKVITDTETYRYQVVYQLPGEAPQEPLYSADFTITANKLVQAPPANPVNDDANNTFTWTDASGKTFADMEYSILGSPFADVPAKPLPVGDRDLAVGDVQVRYKQTATHNASPILSNAVAFVGTPALQPADPRNGKGLIDNVAINEVGSNVEHVEGSTDRNGNTWTNNWVLTTRKAAAGTQVYIETLINKGGAYDFFYGFKTTPTLGDVNAFDVAISISEFGIITATSKQNGTQGFGDLLTGDLFRLYRLANGTLKTTYVRDGVENEISVVTNVSLPGDLYVCLNLREDTAAKIINPKTYGLSPA